MINAKNKNIMWESHRMILPEVREELKKRNIIEKIPKPILTEDYIQELIIKLQECFKAGISAEFNYYYSGYIRTIEGKILKIHDYYMSIFTETGTKIIYLENLLDITLHY